MQSLGTGSMLSTCIWGRLLLLLKPWLSRLPLVLMLGGFCMGAWARDERLAGACLRRCILHPPAASTRVPCSSSMFGHDLPLLPILSPL
jgi:hypothetical protein